MSDADSKAYARDPGDRFASDVHRRVLAHLSLPEDEYGWRTEALIERMRADRSTDLNDSHEMTVVLEDLEGDGHAERLDTPGGEVWRMTDQGLETLQSGIVNEPPPDAAVQGPADMGPFNAGAAATLLSGSVQANGNSAEGSDQS